MTNGAKAVGGADGSVELTWADQELSLLQRHMVSIYILTSVLSHLILSSLGLAFPVALHLPLPAHLVSVSPLLLVSYSFQHCL